MRREILAHTDAHTEALYTLEGANRLIFPVSRLLVDPERFRDDVDEVMASQGLGAVYTRTSHGEPLKDSCCREALLAKYYDPHHAKLLDWTRSAVRQHGRCLILDCHSFPSVPLACDLDQTPDRPDACLGTDPNLTRGEMVRAALDVFEAAGWSCLVDRPYAGTIAPLVYARDERVSSIMIEINRRRYMNEGTGERSRDFDAVRTLATRVLEAVWESLPLHN